MTEEQYRRFSLLRENHAVLELALTQHPYGSALQDEAMKDLQTFYRINGGEYHMLSILRLRALKEAQMRLSKMGVDNLQRIPHNESTM